MMICEGPSHNFISSGGHDWQERSAVILIEVRRQRTESKDPASVCIAKNVKGFFHNEPEWIRKEGRG
jgi:hypothetical protein